MPLLARTARCRLRRQLPALWWRSAAHGTGACLRGEVSPSSRTSSVSRALRSLSRLDPTKQHSSPRTPSLFRRSWGVRAGRPGRVRLSAQPTRSFGTRVTGQLQSGWPTDRSGYPPAQAVHNPSRSVRKNWFSCPHTVVLLLTWFLCVMSGTFHCPDSLLPSDSTQSQTSLGTPSCRVPATAGDPPPYHWRSTKAGASSLRKDDAWSTRDAISPWRLRPVGASIAHPGRTRIDYINRYVSFPDA
jgi:hypothetical protein